MYKIVKNTNIEIPQNPLLLLSRSPPGLIREIEGFATHICVTREMGMFSRRIYATPGQDELSNLVKGQTVSIFNALPSKLTPGMQV